MSITRNSFIILNVIALFFYVLSTTIALAGDSLTYAVKSSAIVFAVIGVAVHLYLLIVTAKTAYFTL